MQGDKRRIEFKTRILPLLPSRICHAASPVTNSPALRTTGILPEMWVVYETGCPRICDTSFHHCRKTATTSPTRTSRRALAPGPRSRARVRPPAASLSPRRAMSRHHPPALIRVAVRGWNCRHVYAPCSTLSSRLSDPKCLSAHMST